MIVFSIPGNLHLILWQCTLKHNYSSTQSRDSMMGTRSHLLEDSIS